MFALVDNSHTRQFYPEFFADSQTTKYCTQTDSVEVTKDNPVPVGVFVVDDFPLRDFATNEAGWPRNSIAMLAHAQSMEEFNAMLNRFQLLKNENTLPDDMTIEQAMATIKPRYYQSAAEMELFAEQLARFDELSKTSDGAPQPEQKVDQPVVSAADAPAE